MHTAVGECLRALFFAGVGGGGRLTTGIYFQLDGADGEMGIAVFVFFGVRVYAYTACVALHHDFFVALDALLCLPPAHTGVSHAVFMLLSVSLFSIGKRSQDQTFFADGSRFGACGTPAAAVACFDAEV